MKKAARSLYPALTLLCPPSFCISFHLLNSSHNYLERAGFLISLELHSSLSHRAHMSGPTCRDLSINPAQFLAAASVSSPPKKTHTWLCSPASRATTNPWSFKTSLTVPLSVQSLSLWQRIVKWEKPWNQTSGTWIPVFALLWTYCVTLSRSFSTFSTFIYSSACWEHEINE